jgi:hypothetical protein
MPKAAAVATIMFTPIAAWSWTSENVPFNPACAAGGLDALQSK